MDKVPEKEKVINDEINKKFADSDTPVYKFEAEDSPEEKAKQTLEDSGGGPKSNTIGPNAKKITTDTDASQTTEEETESTSKRLSTLLPGSIPSVVESVEIPDWARTGWQRVTGAGESDKDIFDEVLGEKFFGQLWLNATVVFVSVFLTYIITSLGGGIGWVIIISAFVGKIIFFSIDIIPLHYRIHMINPFSIGSQERILRILSNDFIVMQETKLVVNLQRKNWSFTKSQQNGLTNFYVDFGLFMNLYYQQRL